MKKFLISLAGVLIILGIVYVALYWNDITHPREINISVSTDSVLVPVNPPREYGIPIDSFHIVRQSVKRNEFLGQLLAGYHIPPSVVDQIVKKSEGVFDFRKIRYGNKFTFFLEKDSAQLVKYVVYEHTPTNYVRINLADSISVQLGAKEIKEVKKQFAATIQSSLWNTMVSNGVNAMLAIELSELYAWSIDFFGLQEGDSFNVVYNEQYVDSLSVGLGKIYAAYFRHAKQDFYAIPFVQDSTLSYFDTDGNSLRKAFLKAPLRYSRISSRFSHSRMHPILKIRRPHLGVDYAAPIGTPVLAIGDGKIIKKGYYKGAGNLVKIKHNSVYTTAYMHLSRYGKGVQTGAYVKQGDVIGYVGSTGLSTGPHLDFRFYKNGSPIDPLKVEAPPVSPVHEHLLNKFDSVKTEVLNELANTPGF